MTLLERAQALPNGHRLKQILEGLLRTGAPKILIWGREFHAFWNDAYASLDTSTDMSRCGMSLPSALPDIWSQICETVKQVMQGAEKLSGRIVLGGQSSDETALSCTAYFTPLYGDGANAEGVLVDVHETLTDRPLSEPLMIQNRQMQQLIAEMPALMAYAHGKDLRLQFVNTAFRRFYGFRLLEGCRLAKAIPEAVEQGFDLILQKVLHTGEAHIGTSTPVRVRNPSGEVIRYVDYIYQPVHNARGETEGVLCTAVDVTDQQRLKFEKEQLKRRALHASRINAMGTMAMTLAHELNQPLAAANNFFAAFRRHMQNSGMNDRVGLEMFESGVEQIRRVGLIIGRTRPLLQTGKAHRQEVRISCAVDNAISLLAAGRDLDLAISKDIPATAASVLVDEVQLEQVLVNLLRNAAEASRCALRKEVIISSRLADRNCVRLSVRDFGRGLNEEELEEIFEIGGGSRRTGLGIGLPLCRTLIEANGGTLWAAAAPGGGAEFLLDLERAPVIA